MPPPQSLADYPLHAYDKLRYGDTDRQGHINNAVFATMLETGRVELLLPMEAAVNDPDCDFVIASLHLDFHHEVTWPGRVDIGTRVARIGRSSLTLEQGIFQNDRCVATATTVIVQTSVRTRRSHPLSEVAVERLGVLMTPPVSRGAAR